MARPRHRRRHRVIRKLQRLPISLDLKQLLGWHIVLALQLDRPRQMDADVQ
jgi:hypothetical protein